MRNIIFEFGMQIVECGTMKAEKGNNGSMEWWKAPANAIVMRWKGVL